MYNKRRYCKHIMFAFIKVASQFYNRVLRIKLHELLWAIMLTTTIAFVLYLRSEKLQKISVKPIIVWWTEGFPGVEETKTCPGDVKCEVYCDKTVENAKAYLFYGSNINIYDLPKPSRDVVWGLYHEESPRNVEELMHEEMLNLFNYSATFSRHSDIPFPLQYLDSIEDTTSTKYFVETSEKNGYLNEISSIMYLQTDCETSTERDMYVKELMKITQVDSYGACLKNKEMPEKFTEDYLNNLDDEEFLKFIARYKFVIAIENAVCDDYVTEKFWRAIKIGTVPIYFGSPSIRDWLPNEKSAILIKDFPTPELLLNHINELSRNDTMYEEYLEHKTKRIITNDRLAKELQKRPYQRNAMETAQVFECFVCKKLHDEVAGTSIVNKHHYDCPKPVSALTLNTNPHNFWLFSWEAAKKRVAKLYENLNQI